MSMVTNNLKVREVINQVVNDPKYGIVSSVPFISIPQVALLLFTLTLIFGGIYLASIGTSLWIVYPFLIFGFYTSFTTLHDAAHRAISSNKFLNDFLGTLGGNLLFPFNSTSVYRYFHLAHHRYVGDKELDPDEAMVAIPTKYFPFGYLVFFVYEYFTFRWLFTKIWDRTPTVMRRKIVIAIAANFIFHTIMFNSPWGYEYFMWFFIPNRLGAALTTFLFAHLPHPEGVHWNNHPFQATFKLTGNPITVKSLWGQSNHAIHHFLPHVPWYKYHKAYDLANGVFHKQNIPERAVFSAPEPQFKERIITQGLIDNGNKLLKAKVTSVKDESDKIKSFVLEPRIGEAFPAFTAGSHININLSNNKIRSYSLVNPSYEKNRYQIAVKLEQEGKGGSKEMHESITIGSEITISAPKNNFLLYENVQKYILISGGIGITPLISMAHKLTALDKHFEFHICTKAGQHIPFQYELQNWTFAPNIDIHIDKNGKSTMDLTKILAKPDDNTLIYVCGPAGFNNWIKTTALNQGWEKKYIKEELFSNTNTAFLPAKTFELILNKSGKSITVDKNVSIIDALLLNNLKVEYSCLQGTCGTCITNVVSGEIDHRDAVFSEEEKIAGDKMCICVSRALGKQIVLDL